MKRMIAEIGRIGAGALAAVAMVIGYSTLAPEPRITVHELTYRDGAIVQAREVTGRAPVVARWEAMILHGATRRPVCSGRGFWAYTLGRAAPAIPLDEWAGDAGCLDRLQAGVTYQPCATYTWADGEQSRQCGLGFRR